MDLREAFEKAQQILLEEQGYPTCRYTYVAKEPGLGGSTTESLMKLAATMGLGSERTERPRKVHENPKEYKFESVNFDLLAKVFNQVKEPERPSFVSGLLQFVEKAFPAQRAAGNSFPTVNYESSMLPLVAEFCVRAGYLKHLLEATKKPKLPVSSLAMMLMQWRRCLP